MQQIIAQLEAGLNRAERLERNGTMWWRKERAPGSSALIAIANAFFWAAANPVRVFQTRNWQHWEVACSTLLHGADHATRLAGRAVVTREFPGESLSQHLRRGTLTPEMLAAAGAEMRRGHSLSCAEFPGGWSHGDAHLGNFIFHGPEQRARLMDFEVRHHLSLGATDRHADDLRVFLQDLAGRIDAAQWRPCALAFLQSYGCPEIIAALRERLILPSWLHPCARVWWRVRTTYLPARELRRRLAELREAL